MKLLPHQLAFLDQQNVLVIENRRYLMMMWITRRKDKMELLTEPELGAIDQAGRLYTLIAEQVVTDGRNRDGDLAELRALIHGIQNMIKGQAAGRAYPGSFRLLGR